VRRLTNQYSVLSPQTDACRSDHIQAKINEAVNLRVKSEVTQAVENSKIVEILQKLSADNKQLLEQSKRKLENSWVFSFHSQNYFNNIRGRESRRLNSSFDEKNNFDEPLNVIVDTRGEKSSLYPNTLRHLFSYNGESTMALLRMAPN
jgi:hypothetical protein